MHFALPTSGLVLPCAVPNFTGIPVVIAQPAYSVYMYACLCTDVFNYVSVCMCVHVCVCMYVSKYLCVCMCLGVYVIHNLTKCKTYFCFF